MSIEMPSSSKPAAHKQRPANLSPAQLVALQSKLKKYERRCYEPIRVLDRGQSNQFPLSFTQQRLWFLDQLEENLAAYNMADTWRLRGKLDVEVLRKALEAIVQRHEPLSTTFHLVDGEPVQTIRPLSRLELPLDDLSSLSKEERDIQVTERCHQEAERTFDLGQDLMIRVLLLRLAADEHVLQIVVHHIASDGWSTRIRHRELSDLYDAFSRGVSLELPDLRVQYADYAVSQRKMLTGKRLERLKQYWCEQLRDLRPLELPTDRPRPARMSYRGGRHTFSVNAELTGQLVALSRKENVTLHMLTLAAFQVLLARYSGQDDIAIGMPIAGRNQSSLDNLIGFFANTLVLRTTLGSDLTFRELLQRIRKTSLSAYDHQEMPFEKLVEELAPERHLNRNPLFQVMFQLLNLGNEELQLRDIEVSRMPSNSQPNRFDLAMRLLQQGSNVDGSVEYSTDLFDHTTIERMTGNYLALLRGIVADPDRRLSELPLVTTAERHQLLVEWNDTSVDYPRDKCVHELFEQQVEQTPDATALVFEDQEMSYRELNERANLLANHLRTLGVEGETLVGLCLERSLELIVGILGILKAGGAYVPLDAEYPSERLKFMLLDANVQYFLTQRALLDRLPVGARSEDPQSRFGSPTIAVCVDTDLPDSLDARRSNAFVDINGDNLAYVMYTSGSTGQPKASLIQHASITAIVYGNDYLNFGANRTFLQLAPISFDASTLEIWSALLNGAKLVIAPPGPPDYKELERTIKQNRVTTMWLTASLFNEVIEQYPQALEIVDEVITGGESLSIRHIRLAQERLPGVQLINGYGPTENTTITTHYRIPRGLPTHVASIPIGTPIANTQVYVLDAQRQPVPVGVAGELYAGGAGVARGYLNRPNLTAQRFVPNPFSADPESRLYKTGDICRWNSAGTLEFIGRTDDQVKLHGYRIELGEIESVLNEHPEVLQSTVVVRQDRPGDKRLVAYYKTVALSAKERSFSERTAAIKRHLYERLPGQMVPSAFVELDAFPLSPTGKIDRQALPAPHNDRPELKTEFVKPRNATEIELARIWCEVLGVQRVGVHDNFFHLGGHSLMATRVLARISTELMIDLPLRSIFDFPTVAELARDIQANGGRTRGAMTSFKADEKHLPLSFEQRRFWFLEQLASDETAANSVVVAHRLSGPLDVNALSGALDELVCRHEILRTIYPNVDGQTVQRISPSSSELLTIDDIRHVPLSRRESEIRQRITNESCRRIDLSTGPVFRSRLIRLGEDEYVLVLVIHHIAVDYWSVSILHREIATLYNAKKNGSPSPLPELPLQYADYTVWQSDQSRSAVLEKQLTYWKNRLQDVPSAEIPTDYPRRGKRSFRGARESLTLSDELVQAVAKLCQQNGVTRFITMLAVLNVLVHRISGERDVAVGAPMAGRNRAEDQDLIGCFLNTVVFRTNVSGNPTFRQLLKRVRDTAIGAYSNQDVAFERLVQELRPTSNVSKSPFFQVFLNDFSKDEKSSLELDGLSSTLLEKSNAAANFDITLYVFQHEGRTILHLVYDVELFRNDRMAEMLRQFTGILTQVVENPDVHIDSLSLVTSESAPVFPDPSIELESPEQQLVTTHITDWAERAPDQIAVCSGTTIWTYRELVTTADRMSRELSAAGVQAGDVVAVQGKPSFGLINSVVAILQSGGVMLLIDPDLPEARKTSMFREACTQFVVDCDDDQRPSIHSYSNGLRRPSYKRSEDAAYIFFTSGTTGDPKGILGSHQGLSHFVNWQREQFRIGPDDRVAQATNLSFDVILREIFLPLTSGATLCVPERPIDSPPEFWRWIDSQQISVLHSVPSRLRMWLDDASDDVSLGSIRWLFMAGEPLPDSLVKAWRSSFAGEIVNLYGPTETTMVKTWAQIPPDSELRYGIQPIGRPLPQTQALVINGDHRLCGIGELGEIVIRTPFLSLGYLDAEHNRSRFVKNPFTDDDRDVIYRTGDLGRYLPDGQIEFTGRLDDQIKIRGVRIEPAEIAAALCAHQHVAACHVGSVEDESGELKLVAWVVNPPGCQSSANELRVYVSRQMPMVFVPSHFVFLDALPLSANGKVDRRALPAPSEISDSRAVYVAPRSVIEKQLAAIWCDVLGCDRPGIHDNFFELGGHSLLATQVVARIFSLANVEITIGKVFELPTIAELAAEITAQDVSKCVAGVETSPVPVSRKADMCPLSFGQQRMWLVDQIDDNSFAYNMPFMWKLLGPLNTEALRRGFDTIVSRHEALRTTFTMADEPVQVVGAKQRFELPIEDLASLTPEELDEAILLRRRKEAELPFDLSRDLMLRASLLRRGHDEHVLFLTLHHIACDGWSIQILFRELGHLYDSFCCGSHPDLPKLPTQYIDYAAQQRNLLAGERLTKLERYWEDQLKGISSLDLPTDHPRSQQSNVARRYHFAVDRVLVQKLKSISQAENVTLHMTLLAAFQTLLSRYTSQEDIAVGTPIAGRTDVSLEDLIGFFVNTLVLRTDLSGDPSFRELLGRVREVSLNAYHQQDLPFEKLVEHLQPERNLHQNPFVQVMFQLHNFSDTALALHGLGVTAVPRNSGGARFDLEMSLRQEKDRLRGTMAFNAGLFDETTIERMVGHYVTLLEGIVTDAAQKISELPLLSERERHQLLVEWNNTTAAFPCDTCAYQLFEQQAEQTPDAVAVICEGQLLTYRELNERSNQLAYYLQSLGVGPGSIVALCLDRSTDLVIGVLGILKAGGAYVPLDVDHPPARLETILSDANVHLFVTDKQSSSRIPTTSGVTFCLDTDFDRLGRMPRTNPQTHLTPGDIAYVIYTSGSTGKPKGVCISHGSLTNVLCALHPVLRPAPGKRFLGLASPTFDISVAEMFLPLISGGTAILVSNETSRDVNTLRKTIDETQPHVIQATPTHWSMILESGWPGDKQVMAISGGEALSRPLGQRLLAAFGTVWNFYGPTETTIWSTVERVTDGENCDSIGRPIANTTVYILDKQREPVPVGIPGELYIGGAGLARGYLNRPKLTAERFVPNPFGDDPNSRLYRTGDLCRWRAHGSLEFLGRLDDQVKLRGHRIELGEIESVLNEHPLVAKSIVALQENQQGESRLVAYYVSKTNGSPNCSDLKRHSQDKLPSYMVPFAFVKLDAIPLTSSGKTDRRALPIPDSCSEIDASYVAPSSHLEQQIATVWGEVFGIERIGIHDDFFALGGHSLLATRVASRLSAMLGMDLPMRWLFEHTTIAELAVEIHAKRKISASISVVPRKEKSEFHCPQIESPWFGKRECNLVIVLNEGFEGASFEKIAAYVREFDAQINVAVVRNTPNNRVDLEQRPTLIFSPAVIRHYPCETGRVFCGYPMSKSEEYTALERLGIPVPKWALLTENEFPDLSQFGDYVVRKPDHGGRGDGVTIMKKSRVKWRPIITKSAGENLAAIIQEFIYTGPRPISYRVSTLFGKTLHACRFTASASRPSLLGPHDISSVTQKSGFSIVASGGGSESEPSYDEDIIRAAEAAHAAFPEIPLLGFDVVREALSGRVYIVEANAIGFTWQFSADMAQSFDFAYEKQFDGLRKAAYVLAERTQQQACDDVIEDKKVLQKLRIENNRATSTAITRVHSELLSANPLQLSFAQQRLWFLDQMNGELTAYNMPSAWRLRGAINLEALRRALETIVQRHEPLRTNFVTIEGEPVQFVRDCEHFGLPVEDLSGLTPRAWPGEISRRCHAEANRPFDLSDNLMLRATLLHFRDTQHVLMLTMHHIACDGWSQAILLRELSELYSAYSAGNEHELPELPIRYADYTMRQREKLRGERLEKLLDFWSKELRDAPRVLDLPTDFPRSEQQTFRGQRECTTLDPELTAAVQELGREAKTTTFMTVLAMFQLLLSRLSGQTDVVVGAPIAGRTQRECEPLIGFFVNTLALRGVLSESATFRNLLAQVRETTLNAYEHQDLPFEKLVEELRPERNLSRPAIVQVLLNGNVNRADLTLPGVTTELLAVCEESTSKFDLTLYMREQDSTITLTLAYNADLYSNGRMKEMLRQFVQVASQVVENADCHIDSYSLVTPESRSLLPDPTVELDSPPQQTVTSMIAGWAERTPDQTALRHGGNEYVYRDLWSVSQVVASKLQGCGVQKGEAVAVIGKSTFGLVASIIGVMSNANVLVLIDPEIPNERRRKMADHAGCRTAIVVDDSSRFLASRSRRASGGSEKVNSQEFGYENVIHIDAYQATVAPTQDDQTTHAPVRNVQPDDPAYIFFTSGTTGEPKGVVGPHKALSQFLDWQRRKFRVTSKDRVAQLGSLSSESVMRDFFLPLTSGGKLCLPESRESADVWQCLERDGITLAHAVPSLLDSWLQNVPDNVRLASLRHLFVGGELLRRSLVEDWRTRFPESGTLVNLYGTTETPQGRSYYEVSNDADWRHELYPIGRAIEDTQALILGENNRLCGVGELGEIAIRTPFLSHGYMEAEQNDGRFIKNPFRDDDNDLMYRTGDLGRFLPDGQIEIVGRRDDQLSIRGVRVEPAEVAAVLSQHPDVDGCFAAPVKDESGASGLIAYIVPAEGHELDPTDLKTYLSNHLSPPMIPAKFIWLDHIPLSANGKIDRAALPAPDQDQPSIQARYAAPRTSRERALAVIWKNAMSLNHEVGIHDDFFDLGGHSLLAVRLVTEIEKEFGHKLPLAALFQLSTIAELASVLGEPEQPPPSSSEKFATLSEVAESLHLSSKIYRQLMTYTAGWKGKRVAPDSLVFGMNTDGAQQPIYWCFQGFEELESLARHLGEDQPIYGMRSGHRVMEYTPENVQSLAAHYVREIRAVQPNGPYFFGGNCQSALIAGEMATQLQAQNETITLLSILDGPIPSSYLGRIAFFSGVESSYNPYRYFHDPALGWQKLDSTGFTFDEIAGGHGEFFHIQANVESLAESLQRRIRQAHETPLTPAASHTPSLPQETYQAKITAPGWLSGNVDERITFGVTVMNTSPVTWQSTRKSGIMLGNHWIDRKGRVVRWLDGIAHLSQDLPPGDESELELQVTLPAKRGRYSLQLDMVEQGVTWFSTKGSTVASIDVRVSSGELTKKVKGLLSRLWVRAA